MADIVNLRRARKDKAKRERETEADANRRRFGRTRAEKDADRDAADRAARLARESGRPLTLTLTSYCWGFSVAFMICKRYTFSILPPLTMRAKEARSRTTSTLNVLRVSKLPNNKATTNNKMPV